MKKLLLVSVSALSITACGGGSGGNTTTSDSNTTNTTSTTPTPSGLCANSGIVTLNGLSIKISDYDTDKNGCLNGDEVAQATKAEQAKQAKRTVTATPIIKEKNNYQIKSLSLTGNRAAVDDAGTKKAIINANEEFSINIDVSNYQSKRLRVSGDSSQGTIKDLLLISINEKTGSEIYTSKKLGKNIQLYGVKQPLKLTCKYGNGSAPDLKSNNYTCSVGGETVTKDNTGNVPNGTSNIYLVVLSAYEITKDGKQSYGLNENYANIKIEISQP